MRIGVDGGSHLGEEVVPRDCRVLGGELPDVILERGVDAALIVALYLEIAADMGVGVGEPVVGERGEDERILLDAGDGGRAPILEGGLGHLESEPD